MLPAFTSSEAYPFCRCSKFNADGVALFFAFAGAAGVGRRTVVMNADWLPGEKFIAKRRGGIEKPKKARELTVMPKTAGETDKIGTNEKTWMMPLQHAIPYAIRRR
jgi:hypothetical protein